MAAYEPPAVRSRSAPRRQAARRRARPSRGRLLVRRLVALALVVFLGSELISFTSAVLQPSNVSFGVRSIEWLRGHGGAWLVNDIERVYYSINAPQKGGAPLKSLPSVGLGDGGGAAAAYQPPAIQPVIDPPLAGEGMWRRTGPLANGAAPLLITTFRPDATYPQMVAGVAWMDRSRTTAQLYPGRYEPPSGAQGGATEVPQQARGSLVATFNSGFKLEDSGGGFFAFGHVSAPLRPGLASLVGFQDGSVDVRAWDGPPQPGPQVLFARQNLPLILDNGQLTPNLSDGREWGATLGNAIRVWRSGVGVDARGDLLYAAADNQTVTSLAQILQRAGAIRAMELDINYEWVTFNSYASPGGIDPSKLLPGMSRPSTRYLSPDDRDFIAVFSRSSG